MTMNRPYPHMPLLGCAVLLAACGDGEQAQQIIDANSFTVRREDLPIAVRENAELQALRETIVRSEVEGQATIIFIAPEGQLVKQGERLVELDVSELVSKRATQAISVAKADAALKQARKEKEILEKELRTKTNTANSNLTIAEMELEKLLGSNSNGGTEGRNGDMIKRISELVAMPPMEPPEPEEPAAGDKARASLVVASVNPASYAGLVNKVLGLLIVDNDKAAALDRDMGEMANKILQQADTIRLAMADLKIKEDTYGHSRRLATKSFITRNELEKDQLAYQAQVSKVSLAWNDLDLLINYTLPQSRLKVRKDYENASLDVERVIAANESAITKADSDLFSKDAELRLATERLNNLDKQIRGAVITAPTPGVVVYARIDRGRGGDAVREGVQVRERQELIILPDTTKMRCVIKVQEAQVDKVARGQQANVQVEAYPGETFTGRVTSVAPVADSNSGWMTTDRKVYTTNVELDGDNPDFRLRSRMAAAVTIVVETVKDVLPVPLQAVRRDRSVNYIWKHTAAGPVATPVQAGRHNSERVVIMEGVAEGDLVYLTPPIGVSEPKFEQPAMPVAAPLKDDGKAEPGMRGNPGGDQAGPGGNRGNRGSRGNRGMGPTKKLAEMNAEELQQFKDGLSRWDGMLDRMRDSMTEEQVQKFETSLAAVKKALDANKLDEAQAAMDAIRATMPRMGGGNRGGNGQGGRGGSEPPPSGGQGRGN